MKILCTICARSGSKGLKGKNMIQLKNKPLIMHTYELAKNIKKIRDIVISTDSKRIQNLIGVKNCWFKRNKKLSGDRISKIKVIIDAVNKAEKKNNIIYDTIIDLDVTSPLRTKKDVLDSLSKFVKKNYDNLFSVTNASKNPYFNMVEFKNNKISLVKSSVNYSSRQVAPIVFSMNASIYIWKRKALFSNKPLFSNKTGIYVMPKERSFDIDDLIDLKIVKCLSN